MSSFRFQSPVANNATELTSGTWADIMEKRRATKTDCLMFPYIPVQEIPEMARQWYPFEQESAPPGFEFVESHNSLCFNQQLYADLLRERQDVAHRKGMKAGLPYRFNMRNGTIDLPMGAQVVPPAGSEALKRKRSPSPSPTFSLPLRQKARPSSPHATSPPLRQEATPQWSPRSTDCKFPTPALQERMQNMNARAGHSSVGTPGFGVQLPSDSRGTCAAEVQRQPRALYQPPGPGSSQVRTQRGSRGRSDSTVSRPPVPLYPWT
jgi:hypothetical protein